MGNWGSPGNAEPLGLYVVPPGTGQSNLAGFATKG